MGRRQFMLWVRMANDEMERQSGRQVGTWAGTENSDQWQSMREKRDRDRGYALTPRGGAG